MSGSRLRSDTSPTCVPPILRPAQFADGPNPDNRPRTGRAWSLDRPLGTPLWAILAWIVVAGGFVLIGGGNLDLNGTESRLGLAAHEAPGPLGQVYGGWDPGLWPGRVLPSQIWAWGEGGLASSAAVRWPEAVAVLLIGLLLSRRLKNAQGPRASVFFAIAFFGSIGMMQRGNSAGLDLIAGLAVVACWNRVFGRGSGWVAGLYAGLAFLAGGWPPVAMILLPIVILGHRGVKLSWKLVLPIALTFGLWSLWIVRVASTEAWGAALFLPLKALDWGMAPRALFLGLPWTPLALIALLPSVRQGWTAATRELIARWVQLGAVAILAGTLIPGLAPTALVVILVSSALSVGTVLDSAWSGYFTREARRMYLGLALALGLIAAVLLIPLGVYVAATVSAYRPVAALAIVLGLGLFYLMPIVTRGGRTRAAAVLLIALAIGVKLIHWGIYVPEWNYRVSQGPWGRAIGQWIPPSWPMYVVHAWPDDLMFHTGHKVRQVPSPEVLNFHDRTHPLYVLLLPAMFERWPKEAPQIIKVRDFEDERGAVRTLARTEGDLGLSQGGTEQIREE